MWVDDIGSIRLTGQGVHLRNPLGPLVDTSGSESAANVKLEVFGDASGVHQLRPRLPWCSGRGLGLFT